MAERLLVDPATRGVHVQRARELLERPEGALAPELQESSSGPDRNS